MESSWVVLIGHSKDASQTRDLFCRKSATDSRGSPRSFASQKTLAQDEQSVPDRRLFYAKDARSAEIGSKSVKMSIYHSKTVREGTAVRPLVI
jgi:hypothetical protein